MPEHRTTDEEKELCSSRHVKTKLNEIFPPLIENGIIEYDAIGRRISYEETHDVHNSIKQDTNHGQRTSAAICEHLRLPLFLSYIATHFEVRNNLCGTLNPLSYNIFSFLDTAQPVPSSLGYHS